MTEEEKKRKFDDVIDYMDLVSRTISKREKAYTISGLIFLVAWGAWIVSSLAHSTLNGMFLLTLFLALIYDQFCFIRMSRAQAEFRGGVEVLRLLGVLEEGDEDGDARGAIRRFWSEGATIVKGWFAKKGAARKEAYA